MVGLSIALAMFLLPVAEYLIGLAAFARSAGSLGLLLFGVAYIAATVSFLPASVLTIGAGFSWGIPVGIAVVWPASVVGALLAFLLGRYVARNWVTARATAHPRLAAVDQAVEQRAFFIIALLRLSPLVPFNLLNYFLGITRASLRDYLFATTIAMLPGIVLYVYLGSVVTDAVQLAAGHRPDAGGWGTGLFAVGLVATVAVTVYLSRVAGKALESTTAKH